METNKNKSNMTKIQNLMVDLQNIIAKELMARIVERRDLKDEDTFDMIKALENLPSMNYTDLLKVIGRLEKVSDRLEKGSGF